MKVRALWIVAALIAVGHGARAQAVSTADSTAAALYRRALAAENPDDARKDLLLIIVDYSNSPRAEDAMLELAQMEIARGDRAASKQYLERLALEHPTGSSRPRGAYLLGRALADEGSMAAACAQFADAKARVAQGDVELSNQITYAARPCAAVQRAIDQAQADSIEKIAQAARADSTARADSAAKAEAAAKKKTAPKKEPVKKEPAKKTPAAAAKTAKPAPSETKGAAWSAQVAAYDSKDAAEVLAKKMTDRGYEARVTGEKPFRVRIGRYGRRTDAIDMVAKLKDAKIAAIVVEAERP